MGGSQAGRWLRGLCDAARDGDIPTLADFFLIPTRLANLGLDDGKGLLIVGLLLQIGVDEAEHLEVLVNVPELTVEEAAARAEDWVSSTREVRAKYDIRVLEHRVHALSPALGRNLLVYAQLRIMGQIAFHLYQAGMVEEASAALQEVVTDAEDLLHGNLTDPLVRSQFADALSRLGFMRATLERFDEARQLLERSAQLALDAHWLEEFNQAYVAARQGRLAEAATFATAAVDHIADRDSFVVLHADLCAPDGFSNGDARWNVVTLNGSWIKRFVSLQAAVWRARSRFEDREALLEQLDGLSRSAPVALLRLAAWAELMVAGRKDQASELFERAIEAAGLDDEDGLREEATRAVELISEVGPEPVQTPEDPAGRASAPEPAPPPERPDGRNGP